MVVSSCVTFARLPLRLALLSVKARRRRPRLETRPLGRVASHFTKEGTPKQSYRTQNEAKQAAQVAWTINRVDLQTYRCDYCNQWHMGKAFRND